MRSALRVFVLSLMLPGCSAAVLDDVNEVGDISQPLPHACSEPTKVFNTFTMQARNVAWRGDKRDGNATLTLDLTFTNDKNHPIALSNSGNGVLYGVEIALQADKVGHAPKEATGVLLTREPKKFEEPPKPGPFGYATPPPKPPDRIDRDDRTRDVNFRIKPGEPEHGRLTFQVPRGNYLLSITRKFDGKPVPGQPSDHIAACKISG